MERGSRSWWAMRASTTLWWIVLLYASSGIRGLDQVIVRISCLTVTISILGTGVAGSHTCCTIGYCSSCCTPNRHSSCYAWNGYCWCDSLCRFRGDCCYDVHSSCYYCKLCTKTHETRCPNTSHFFTLAQCTTHGSIRVAGGSSNSRGRVEICLNNVWGTVCHDGWSQVDANVACRQLGYSNAGICNLNSYFLPTIVQ